MAWLIFSIVAIVLGFLAVVLWSLVAVSQTMDVDTAELTDALRGSVESVVNRRRGVPWDEITDAMITEDKLAESTPDRPWPTGLCVGADVEGFRVRGISDERMEAIAEDWENHKRECMNADAKRLSSIREALTLEMPPLSIADQRFLFFMATGETIKSLPRFAWCHGDGSVERVMNGEAIPVKCGNCNGTGFTR